MTRTQCVLLILCVSCVQYLLTTYKASNNLTCYLCKPGTFFVNDCSAEYQRAVCSPCPNGSFTPDFNLARLCQPCSTVCRNINYQSLEEQPEIKTANCSSTADIQCECRSGFWRESGVHGMCRRVKDCEVGHGVTAVATSYSDTVCEPCEDGQTFCNTSSPNGTCLPCARCHGHMYVKHPCEPDRDTECIPLTSTAELLTPQEDNPKLALGLVIGIPVALLAAGVIVGVCWFVSRRLTKRKRNPAQNNLINGIERPRFHRWPGYGNHVLGLMEPVYVELSNCIPPGDFKMYFRKMHIGEDTIVRVTKENPNDIREQCYQLLVVWKERSKTTMICWTLNGPWNCVDF